MIQEIARLKATRWEMTALSKEYGKVTKTLDRTGKTMKEISREFTSGVDQMQQDLLKLKSELKQINKESTPTGFEKFSSLLNKLAAVKQQVLSIGSEIANISMGTSVGGAIDESKAAARERGLYAAKGKTAEEMQRFDELTRQLMSTNPYLNKPQAMSLISKSEQVNPAHAEKYAEKAAQLSVTTRYAPEEHLKMMAAMRQSTGIDDATRLANSIQYMSNNAGDLNGKFVDAIVEFSAQNSKLLDTPEKMAAMVSEIGKLGVWSDDKAFAALRESTLKFTDQGELTNLLKSQYEAQGKGKTEAQSMAEAEAMQISGALSSGDRDEERVALGKLMMSVATIQDKAVQQKVLQSLGGNAGKELGSDLPKLLETAGKIATGEIRPQVGNEADKAYEAAKEADSYFAVTQAQSLAKHDVTDAIAKVFEDLTTPMTELAEVVGGAARLFNDAGDGVRYFTEALIVAFGAFMGGGQFVVTTKELFGGRKKKSGKGGAGDTHAGEDVPRNSNKGPSQTGGNSPVKKGKVSNLVSRIFQSEESLPLLNSGTKGLLRKIPLLGLGVGAVDVMQSDNKLEAMGEMGAEAIGGWGGAAVGAAAGAAVGSVVPILGTALGGVIGGVIGSFGGSIAGSKAFEGIKSWWQDEPSAPATEPKRPPSKEEWQSIRSTMPAGPPVPQHSPVSGIQERAQSVSLTIPQITIPLHADGVLQDIPTMLRMLGDPSVGQKIKSIIEKALLDALETRGGVPV